MMRIGELAAKSGRSIYTIRWYEAQRLMPGVARDQGGRRTYTKLHVTWLEFLERLKRSGMSIRQMREYAALVKRGESTLTERRELLQAHKERVQGKIEDLRESIQVIDTKLDFYADKIAKRHADQ